MMIGGIPLNEKKICFISSVNDMRRYNESLGYWKKLSVPEGMYVDFMTITGASSMVEAYQAGMEATDAKYKIYIHQDVWIVGKDFLHTMLNCFKSDKSIGLAGVVGSRYLPRSLAWWEADDKIGAVCDDHLGSMQAYTYGCGYEKSQAAAAIDGLILITQYDIPWRTDIFNNWHFYDTSQCMEFHRMDLQVVVLPVDGISPPVWHWCGRKLLTDDYHGEQKKFIKEYGEEVIEKWLRI